MKKAGISIIVLLLLFGKAKAQSLAINTDGSTADNSSILDVKSTTKGLLIPRMDKIEKLAIVAPAKGLLVYQIAPDSIGFYYFDGGSWVWLQNTTGPGSGWSITGNAGTNPITNALGTLDAKALKFIQNGLYIGLIDGFNLNYFIGRAAGISTIGTSNIAFGDSALSSNTSGTANTAIGTEVLKKNIIGGFNVGMGYRSLKNNTNTGNVAAGPSSLEDNTTGSFNTAIGTDAHRHNISGIGNLALGNQALLSDKTGGNNVVVGNQALKFDTTGSETVAVGVQALLHNQSRFGNTAVGTNSLYWNTYTTSTPIGVSEGLENSALGHSALFNNRRGSDNVAIGYQANYTDTAAASSVAIGAYALRSSLGGVWNTAIGGDALRNSVRGVLNSAVGFRTLKSLLDGGENNTLGVGTMEYKDTALSCVAIGRFALSGSSSFNNSPDTGSIAIGTSAGRFNNTNYNTFIGYQSGIGSPANPLGITGGETVSIGAFSLSKLQSGNSNVTFGNAAQFNNQSGNGNIGIGTRSLFNNGSGSYSVAIGDSASYGNALNGSSRNIAIGAFALRNVGNISSNNIAIGDSSMYGNNNFNAYQNTALGNNSLHNTALGNNNVAIGYQAGYNNTTQNGNVFIGNQAGSVASSSNKLYIQNDNADSTNALIYGDFAADSLNLNAKVNIRDYTRLGTEASGAPAIKMKKIIVATGPAVNALASYSMGGIADAKVLGVQVLLDYGSGKIPPSYNDSPGYEYNIQVQFGNIVIINKTGNSASIGGKPLTILITYEE